MHAKTIEQIARESAPSEISTGDENIPNLDGRPLPKVDGLSLATININSENAGDPRVQNLLKAIHGGLYQVAHPLTSEQETVENWIDRAKNKSRYPKQFITAHFTDIAKASEIADKIAALPANSPEFQKLHKELAKLTVGFMSGEYFGRTNAARINCVIDRSAYEAPYEDITPLITDMPKYPTKLMVDYQIGQYGKAAEKDGGLHLVVRTALARGGQIQLFRTMEEDHEASSIDNLSVVPAPLSPGQLLLPSNVHLYSYETGLTITGKQQAEALEKYISCSYQVYPIYGKFQNAQEFAADCAAKEKQIRILRHKIDNPRTGFLQRAIGYTSYRDISGMGHFGEGDGDILNGKTYDILLEEEKERIGRNQAIAASKKQSAIEQASLKLRLVFDVLPKAHTLCYSGQKNSLPKDLVAKIQEIIQTEVSKGSIPKGKETTALKLCLDLLVQDLSSAAYKVGHMLQQVGEIKQKANTDPEEPITTMRYHNQTTYDQTIASHKAQEVRGEKDYSALQRKAHMQPWSNGASPTLTPKKEIAPPLAAQSTIGANQVYIYSTPKDVPPVDKQVASILRQIEEYNSSLTTTDPDIRFAYCPASIGFSHGPDSVTDSFITVINSPEALRQLSKLHPQIEILNLGHNAICTKESIEALASLPASIIDLDLSGNSINTPELVKALGKLPETVKYLKLGGSNGPSETIFNDINLINTPDTIVALKHLSKSIEYLDLSKMGITSPEALSALKDLPPTIKELDLSENPISTVESVDALIKALERTSIQNLKIDIKKDLAKHFIDQFKSSSISSLKTIKINRHECTASSKAELSAKLEEKLVSDIKPQSAASRLTTMLGGGKSQRVESPSPSAKRACNFLGSISKALKQCFGLQHHHKAPAQAPTAANTAASQVAGL